MYALAGFTGFCLTVQLKLESIIDTAESSSKSNECGNLKVEFVEKTIPEEITNQRYVKYEQI